MSIPVLIIKHQHLLPTSNSLISQSFLNSLVSPTIISTPVKMRFTTITSLLVATGGIAAAAPLESGILTGGLPAPVKARDDALTGGSIGGLVDRDDALTGAVATGGAFKARDDARTGAVATGGSRKARGAGVSLEILRREDDSLESGALTGAVATGGAFKARDDALTGGSDAGIVARDDALTGAVATGGAFKARDDALTGGILQILRREDDSLESGALTGAIATGGAFKARDDSSCAVATVGDYTWKITKFIGRKPQGTFYNYIAFNVQSTNPGSSLDFRCSVTQTQLPDSKFITCDGSNTFQFSFQNEYNGLMLKYGDAP